MDFDYREGYVRSQRSRLVFFYEGRYYPQIHQHSWVITEIQGNRQKAVWLYKIIDFYLKMEEKIKVRVVR